MILFKMVCTVCIYLLFFIIKMLDQSKFNILQKNALFSYKWAELLQKITKYKSLLVFVQGIWFKQEFNYKIRVNNIIRRDRRDGYGGLDFSYISLLIKRKCPETS
jgi:hypothetical protein